MVHKSVHKIAGYTAIAASFSLLVGCAATQTVLEHGKLDAKTSLSKTIFLDPVSDKQKNDFCCDKKHFR